MHRTLRWFRQTARAGRRPARQPRARRLELERLENLWLLSVSYHGGPVIGHAEVETVYWGQDWTGTTGPVPYLQPGGSYSSFTTGENQQQIQELDTFFTNITDSPYMDLLNQYGVGRGTFEGHDIPPSVTGPPASWATVTDLQIQGMLDGEIRAGRVPSPVDTNQLYFVFTPPTVTVTLNGQTYEGWHSFFKDSLGNMVHYAVVPYPGGAYVSNFLSQTDTASHELAEAVTDPESSGWFETGQPEGEIADLGLNLEGDLNGYDVAELWSNKDNGIVLPQGNARTNPQSGLVSSLATLTDASGYPRVFGIGSDGTVYYKSQDYYGDWSGWTSIGAPRLGLLWYGAKSISVINDGSTWRVFAIGLDNAVYTIAQWESSWTGLGGQAKQVVAGQKADGQLEVFAIGLTDGLIYSDARTGVGSGGWSGTSWTPLAPFGDTSQALQASTIAVDSSTGREEVFAIGADGAVHTIGESFFSLGKFGWWTWGGWVSLGSTRKGSPQSFAVETTADGREEVFAIDGLNYVESIRQDAPGDWSSSQWSLLGGGLLGVVPQVKSISVGRSPFGREEIFAIDSGNHVVSIAQAAPNDGWTDSYWFSMGFLADQVAVVFNHAWSYYGWASADYDELTVAATYHTLVVGGGYFLTSQQTGPEGGWN
jgi:hypothetical protein